MSFGFSMKKPPCGPLIEEITFLRAKACKIFPVKCVGEPIASEIAIIPVFSPCCVFKAI